MMGSFPFGTSTTKIKTKIIKLSHSAISPFMKNKLSKFHTITFMTPSFLPAMMEEMLHFGTQETLKLPSMI